MSRLSLTVLQAASQWKAEKKNFFVLMEMVHTEINICIKYHNIEVLLLSLQQNWLFKLSCLSIKL